MDNTPNFDSAMQELTGLGVPQETIATLDNLVIGETREVMPGVTITRGTEHDGDSYTVNS